MRLIPQLLDYCGVSPRELPLVSQACELIWLSSPADILLQEPPPAEPSCPFLLLGPISPKELVKRKLICFPANLDKDRFQTKANYIIVASPVLRAHSYDEALGN
jgi:hypothetical protein